MSPYAGAAASSSEESDKFDFMNEMTATELARNLSSVLNRVIEGEEVTVTRGGRPIVEIRPSRRQWMKGSDFLATLRSGPSLDPEFGDDVERIRAEYNAMPERSTPLEWD